MPDLPVGPTPSAPAPSRPAPTTSGVVAPPPLLYAVPLGVGLLLQRWYPLRMLAPSVATAVGMACVALGCVGLPAVLAFRRANTSPKPWVPSTALVTTGPFRFTRNPMYLGFTFLYLGVSFWMNAAWPMLFLPIVLTVMHYGVIVREESYMTRTFGEEYSRYRARVRRWL